MAWQCGYLSGWEKLMQWAYGKMYFPKQNTKGWLWELMGDGNCFKSLFNNNGIFDRIKCRVGAGYFFFSLDMIFFYDFYSCFLGPNYFFFFAKSVLFYLLLINWTKNEQFQKNTETTEGQTVRTTNIVNLHTRQPQHPWGERQFYSLINYRLLRGNRVLKFISLFKKSNSSKHVHIKIPFTPL